MNKKVAIAIGVAIIVTLGSYVFTKQTIFNEKQMDVDISDWKSYINPVTNYQVSYPPYWEVEERGGDISLVMFRDPMSPTVFTEDSKSSASFYSGATTARGLFACSKEVSEDMIEVAGLNATKRTFIFKQSSSIIGCKWSGEAILVEFENRESEQYINYSFEFHLVDGNSILVDQILSTFKFIK